jgi:hypothetical protein
MMVKAWVDGLPVGASRKKHAKDMISSLYDFACFWEIIPPVERNPVHLVKVKGATKRQKPISILSIAQFQALGAICDADFCQSR